MMMEMDIPTPFCIQCFKSHCSVLIFSVVASLGSRNPGRDFNLQPLPAGAPWLSDKKGQWPVRAHEMVHIRQFGVQVLVEVGMEKFPLLDVLCLWCRPQLM
jgi:hypothetical protein